jgi:hypothetical protein
MTKTLESDKGDDVDGVKKATEDYSSSVSPTILPV